MRDQKTGTGIDMTRQQHVDGAERDLATMARDQVVLRFIVIGRRMEHVCAEQRSTRGARTAASGITRWLDVEVTGPLGSVLGGVIEQRTGCSFKLWYVVFDRRGDNRVRSIEVSMGQAVSHARDLGPRQVGLIGEEVGRKRLHGFADLYQPYANRVEDQRIA